MSQIDLSYFAGVFDGEGCISINKRIRNGRPLFQLVCVLLMAEPEFLAKFHYLFGLGHISKTKRQKETHKERVRWSMGDSQAVEFIKMIYPYLRLKKMEADVALKYHKTFDKKIYKKVGVPENVLKIRQSCMEELSAIKKTSRHLEMQLK